MERSAAQAFSPTMSHPYDPIDSHGVSMHKMLQAPIAKDYLIATGKTNSLNDFVRLAFASANLNLERYFIRDDTLLRPSDLRNSAMNPNLSASKLDWQAFFDLPEIVQNTLEEKIR